MAVKYIFVTGGVVSGLGKGITAASLGRLLKNRGYRVTIQKFDPYINVDSGTMNPYQHGEVFVTEDGAETDLDLGHYERFIDENLSVNSNITTGKVYWNVLKKERSGDYLGKTIQVIPHITDEIKSKIYSAVKNSNSDIIITEIGGTVGDIESQPFIEAIRQVGLENPGNCIYIHVTLVPCVPGSYELKSKPTQHSVKQLLSFGVKPSILVCRTDCELPPEIIDKIGLFCNVDSKDVVQNLTAESIYEVPLMLENCGFAKRVCYHLNLEKTESKNEKWIDLVSRLKNLTDFVTIGLVGKYVELPDAYISVVEALKHGGLQNGVNVKIKYLNSQIYDLGFFENEISGCDGVLIPGGFGKRGIEGKLLAIEYCRTKNVPCFGICLGMQLMVVEVLRNVAKISDASSAEFDDGSKNRAIDIMPSQKNVAKKGGTMRLGGYSCRLCVNSKCFQIYGQEQIFERHRHRFEVNNSFRSLMEGAGLKIAGLSPDGNLVEIVELENHDWFIGTQFHPEFKSRPNRAHPLFFSFIEAAIEFKKLNS